MPTHTPGRKWETLSSPLAVCEAGGGDVVAEVVNGSTSDRDLIAAAPDIGPRPTSYS